MTQDNSSSSEKTKILHGDTTGVCYNCLNGFHTACDYDRCSCKKKDHKAWWWKTQEEIDAEEGKPIIIKYTCIKKLITFSEVFAIEEIERGDCKRWQELNATSSGILKREIL